MQNGSVKIRRLLANWWLRAFVLWTAFIGLGVAVVWPGATTPPQPCNYVQAVNPDPALPLCGVDAINAQALLLALLCLLWVVGVGIEAATAIVLWLARLVREERTAWRSSHR